MNKLLQSLVLAGLCSTGAFAQETVLPNKAPQTGSVHITPNTGLCAGGYNYLFSEFSVDDSDGNALTIVSATSSDQSILSDSDISPYTVVQVGNTTRFQVNTYNAQSGTVDITFVVSDGTDQIEVVATVVFGEGLDVSYLGGELYFCSNEGIVNLDEYVTVPGGTFNIWESDIPTLLNVSDYQPGSPYSIYYYLTDGGCEYSAMTSMTIRQAPAVAISVIEQPGCGTSDGSVSAEIIADESTFTYAWSNGIQQEYEIDNLAPGVYFFNVTDDNSGCSGTASVDLVPEGVEIEALSVTDLTCFGSNDGAISVEVTGMTAPYTYYWSSGHTGPSITGLAAGTYTLTVQNETGCTVTANYQVSQPQRIITEAGFSAPTCGEEDGSMYINFTQGGDGEYAYSWSNGDTGGEVSDIGFGIYSVTTTDGAGCTAISTVFVSEQNSANISGTVTPTTCGGENGAIDVNLNPPVPSEAVATISWSNGATTEDIAGLSAMNYICTAVMASGCRSVKSWNVPAVTPLPNPICIVTVDSVTTTNLVVWEKLQTTGISHYNIYRETSQLGEYVLIDTVHYNNLSVFNDVVASPKVRSWRYKISAVNTCGQESALSPHHKTLHLNAFEPNEGSVLITWDAYEGTAYTSYDLWRFTSEDGWEPAATVPASQLSYTDLIDFSTPGLDYLVEMTPAEGCMAEKAQDFNTSRSNKEKGLFVPGSGTGNSNNGLQEAFGKDITVNVYPNPVQDQLSISLAGAAGMEVIFQDVHGKPVLLQKIHEGVTQLDMSSLSAGIYFVQLQLNGVSEVVKVVKQ